MYLVTRYLLRGLRADLAHGEDVHSIRTRSSGLQPHLENYPTPDDHIWHELMDLRSTQRDPTVEITAVVIKSRLKSIAETGRNESEAIKKLEVLK